MASTNECADCGRSIPEDSRHPYCFRCKIRGVSFGFPYGGKDTWHNGPTITETIRETKEKAAINGYTAEPVGTRWV